MMKTLRLIAPQRLEWQDIPFPAMPAAGEVLVAPRCIGVCGTDISAYLGKMPFITEPRILGHELGVEVLAIGDEVQGIAVGDRASVEPYLNCGQCPMCQRDHTNACEALQVLGVHCDGGWRPQFLLPAPKLHVANDLSFESLALVETLAIGCHAVERAGLQQGERALVVGLGPIGLTAVQFALLTGADVTIADHASQRVLAAQDLFPQCLSGSLTAETTYDVVIDATGNAESMASAVQRCAYGGRIVYAGITSEPISLNDPLFHRREQTLLATRNAPSRDFPKIISLIREGRINTASWITQRASFSHLAAIFPTWAKPGSVGIKAMIEMEATSP